MKSVIAPTLALLTLLMTASFAFAEGEEDRPPRADQDGVTDSPVAVVLDSVITTTETAVENLDAKTEAIVQAIITPALEDAKDALQAVQGAETTLQATAAISAASDAIQAVSVASATAADVAQALNQPIDVVSTLQGVETSTVALADAIEDAKPSDVLEPTAKPTRSLVAAARDYLKGADRVAEAKAEFEAAKKRLAEAEAGLSRVESEVAGAGDELRAAVSPSDRYRAFDLGGSVLIVAFRTEGTEILTLESPGL